jgi:hypothetical protein
VGGVVRKDIHTTAEFVGYVTLYSDGCGIAIMPPAGVGKGALLFGPAPVLKFTKNRTPQTVKVRLLPVGRRSAQNSASATLAHRS